MGCFHVGRCRKHLEQEKLRSMRSYNSLYDNQPVLLPDPHTVETLSHSQLLSAPSQSSISDLDLQLACQVSTDQFPPCTVANLIAASGGFGGNSNKSSPEIAILVGRPVPLPVPQETRHPLPLPLQRSSSAANPKCKKQLKSSKTFQSLSFGSEPRPLPLPSQVMSFRFFGSAEIVAGCEGFSPLHWLRNTRVGPVYRCFVTKPGSNDKMEVDVTRMSGSNTKAENECLEYFETLAQVQSPFVSQFLGLCMPQAIVQSVKNSEWLVVSEHCESESLETLLKKQDQSALDWSARMKIALGIARGLDHLHEKAHHQGCFDGDFDMRNILVDRNCNPKLSEYGFQRFFNQDASSVVDISVDQGRSGPAKVAARNFGKVLLALVLARHYLDKILLNDEILQNIRPLLTDAANLGSILNPALRELQVAGSMERVANLAFRCLHDVAGLRPTLQEIVEVLFSLQEVKNTNPMKSFKGLMPPTIAASELPMSRVLNTQPTTQKMFELPQSVAIDKLEENQKTWEQSVGVGPQTPLQPLSMNAAATTTAINTSRSMSSKLDHGPVQKHKQKPNLRCSSSFGRHQLGRKAFQAKLYQTS